MLGVIGDVVQDVVIWPQEPLRPATDTQSTINMLRGGSAANVAAFAGPRHPTRFIGAVGKDLGAPAVTKALTDLGVDVKVQTSDLPTGTIVVLIGDDGERMMFPSRGASGAIEPVQQDWLDDIKLLHVTSYSLATEPSASTVITAARYVKANGGEISLDLSSVGMIDGYGTAQFTQLLTEIAPDFITGNEDECSLLELVTEVGPGPLLEHLPDTVLLARAGTEPTRIFRGPKLLATVPVVPVEIVLDVTGAGDAFNAGFLTRHLAGDDLETSCLAGHALAGRVLAFPGATEHAHE